MKPSLTPIEKSYQQHDTKLTLYIFILDTFAVNNFQK